MRFLDGQYYVEVKDKRYLKVEKNEISDKSLQVILNL